MYLDDVIISLWPSIVQDIEKRPNVISLIGQDTIMRGRETGQDVILKSGILNGCRYPQVVFQTVEIVNASRKLAPQIRIIDMGVNEESHYMIFSGNFSISTANDF